LIGILGGDAIGGRLAKLSDRKDKILIDADAFVRGQFGVPSCSLSRVWYWALMSFVQGPGWLLGDGRQSANWIEVNYLPGMKW
jgi:hypothetical protein